MNCHLSDRQLKRIRQPPKALLTCSIRLPARRFSSCTEHGLDALRKAVADGAIDACRPGSFRQLRAGLV